MAERKRMKGRKKRMERRTEGSQQGGKKEEEKEGARRKQGLGGKESHDYFASMALPYFKKCNLAN